MNDLLDIGLQNPWISTRPFIVLRTFAEGPERWRGSNLIFGANILRDIKINFEEEGMRMLLG